MIPAGIPRLINVMNKSSEEIITGSRSVLTGSEPRRKFFIDAIEAAIRQDRDHVTRLEIRREALDNFGRIRVQFCRCSRMRSRQ